MAPAQVRREITERDARAMLALVTEVSALETPADFAPATLSGLRHLVPCELATYNEIGGHPDEFVAVLDPPDAMPPGGPEALLRYGHQNPALAHYQRTRDGRPYKWSDFFTRRELHATDIYRDLYRPAGVEYQMAFCLPTPPQLIIGLVLNRERRDFSEDDRTVLNLVRPPLIQAYRTVQRYALLTEQLAALESGLEHRSAGVAVLEGDRSGKRRIRVATAEAARALGLNELEGAEVPPDVARWLEPARAGRESQVAPLVMQSRDEPAAVVHYLPAKGRGEGDALLVQRQRDALSLEMMRGAGLSARQAEVLQLVALGDTNDEIARKLVISPRTVQKHLEHVYDKLGATSRTQAVLTAWSIAPAANDEGRP